MIGVLTLIVVAIFIVAALYYLKLEHHGRKVKVIIILLICVVIYFSIIGIFTSNEVDITSPRGIVKGVYLYVGWIGQTASNLWEVGTDTVKTVGNAIKINNTKTEKQPRR